MRAGVPLLRAPSRRQFLRTAGSVGLGLLAAPASAETVIQLSPPLPGGPNDRPLVTDYPTKSAMILQRTRPPLLETPFEVFDQGIFTPNDRFFVRWHWANIPSEVNADTFRLAVRGHVSQEQSLAL